MEERSWTTIFLSINPLTIIHDYFQSKPQTQTCPSFNGARKGTPRSERICCGRCAVCGRGGRREVEISVCAFQRKAEQKRNVLLERLKINQIEAVEVSGVLFQKTGRDGNSAGNSRSTRIYQSTKPDSPNFSSSPTRSVTREISAPCSVLPPRPVCRLFCSSRNDRCLCAESYPRRDGRALPNADPRNDMGRNQNSNEGLDIFIADMDGAPCWETDSANRWLWSSAVKRKAPATKHADLQLRKFPFPWRGR